VVGPLLISADAQRRELGLEPCRLHGADPGPTLLAALRDTDAHVRVAALRTIGVLGRLDLIDAIRDANREGDPVVQRHAAIAATLLGDRGSMLRAVTEVALRDVARCGTELALALQAAEFDAARQLVRALGPDDAAAPSRRQIRAFGVLGDAQFVPWLIGLMDDDRLARVAGESFSMITGADLAALDLERKPPQDFVGGPSDDPGDDDVSLDEDESLPWPDQGLVQRWWRSRAGTMPIGRRLFLGQVPTPECACRALRDGLQRQRLMAAQWLCVLAPGAKLFATAAPAWRQQRRLAKAT
jgi:uncharacterized protein (TIGR02270 family)